MKRSFAILFVMLMLFGFVAAIAEEWTCLSCGSVVSGNFCNNCGTAKPSEDWICPNCGNAATGNFCSNRNGACRKNG